MGKYCDTSKLSIRQIDKPTAKKMVVKYHYSKLWTKCSVALGLFIDTGKEHSFFDEAEEKMIGVIVYGDPIGRLTGQSISDEIDRTEVLELTRLFIHDGYGSNIESYLIGQGFKWLKENQPHIKALISYADPQAGHVGTIYQATNWIYQGNNNRWNDGWNFRMANIDSPRSETPSERAEDNRIHAAAEVVVLERNGEKRTIGVTYDATEGVWQDQGSLHDLSLIHI